MSVGAIPCAEAMRRQTSLNHARSTHRDGRRAREAQSRRSGKGGREAEEEASATHIDLHRRLRDDSLSGVPEADEDDEDELRDEVERAALDDNHDRAVRDAARAGERGVAAGQVRGAPDLEDDEPGGEHVRTEREREARRGERRDRRGRHRGLRSEGDDEVDRLGDAYCRDSYFKGREGKVRGFEHETHRVLQ